MKTLKIRGMKVGKIDLERQLEEEKGRAQKTFDDIQSYLGDM